MFRIHRDSPADAVEQAFFRIRRDTMADVPVHNDALSVEAVDFQRWQGHWLGIVVTSWHMSVVLVPGQAEGWESVSDNQRRFLEFPAGTFPFLGSEEPEVGEFQSLALFSGMGQFTCQSDAVLAARASLLAMMTPRQAPGAEQGRDPEQPSLSRRRLFGLK